MIKHLMEKLIDFSIDITIVIILNLSYEDIISLNITCKKLYEITNSEYIWMQKCLQITGFKSQFYEFSNHNNNNNNNVLNIEKIKNILQYDKYKEFFMTFHNLKYPLLTWYRYLSNESYLLTTLNGGLYCMKLIDNKFIMCQYIDASGNIMLSKSYLLCYSKLNKRCKAIKYNNENERSIEYECKFDSSFHIINNDIEINFIPITTSNSSIYDNSTIDNYNIVSINNSNMSVNFNIIQDMEFYLGFYTSQYGPHGIEIIHTSLEYQSIRPNYNNNIISNIDYDNSSYQIHGMKILGDKNVPSGKLSFIIQLHTNTITITDELLQIIISNHENHSITRNNILYCFDGFGQININPRVWNPSWMNCKFIIYHIPQQSIDINHNNHMNDHDNIRNHIHFSMIWDYGLDSHVMHFKRLNINQYLPLYS